MVTRGISRDARKLTRTPSLSKKNTPIREINALDGNSAMPNFEVHVPIMIRGRLMIGMKDKTSYDR